MRYTLKDYQADAVRDVLDNLSRAADDWRRRDDLSAFSLTATTGAGKTVMAAAVIEALFVGDVDNDFAPDPGAVVLWFTDDPALNEQTRARLQAASDRLSEPGRLEVIENTFAEEKLQPGKVYFLNAQKLSKNALLVRGARPEDDDPEVQTSFDNMPPPDNRARTMWDILRATIQDPNLTLYMVLDEAHRGMKSHHERASIVQRLINGAAGTPPIPVVFGISATVERFDRAMKAQVGRTNRPPVVVDPARVQESGLLKDDIRLEFPAESGSVNTTLLTRATRKLQEATRMWHDYARSEHVDEDTVVPLMVVQMPNKVDNAELQQAVEAIRNAWPEIESDAFANVFGEHRDIELDTAQISYVAPQLVQYRPHIRVLFAKDAISTGWDCPRAEVFVSFRPASDLTYITQLIGRMVRAPLARRIPGNDLLNSVTCLLPRFNRDNARQVAEAMTGSRDHDRDGTGGGEGRRTLLAPLDMTPNVAIGKDVWAAFDRLPSQTLPRKVARPMLRFVSLAHALALDELDKRASHRAYQALCKVLDGFCAQHDYRFKQAVEEVKTVEGEILAVNTYGGRVTTAGSFLETADTRAIEAQYARARRVLTPELARRYAERLAQRDPDNDLLEARIKVAAIGRMDEVTGTLEAAAERMAGEWFDRHRVGIKALSDERCAEYDRIKGMSVHPQRIDLQRPRIRTEETEDADGNPLPVRSHHLMADGNGNFPVGNLNRWEKQVLDTEMDRNEFLAWYRNPARASSDALAVPWRDSAGNWRRMCPDFVFFHGDADTIRASVVDPHGTHLSDAIPKLRGLANFAETFGDELHRIEAVAEVDGELRVLDLKDEHVRAAVLNADDDIKALYTGPASAAYR